MKKTEIEHIVGYSAGLKAHPKWLRRKIIELIRLSVAWKTMNFHKYKTFGEFHKAFKKRFGFSL